MSEQAAARIAKLDEVLRQVPYQYQNRDRMRSDVAQLLQSCSTLQPQTGSFSGGGRTVTLFYLYGVLPINYSGSTYNIPVTIYFDPPYPRQPPRCFVTPTTGMALKSQHPHVDQGGMIYVPYLSSWNERSKLTDLVPTLSSVFSSNPPVYSTASASRPAAASSTASDTSQRIEPIISGIGQALNNLFGAGRGSPGVPAHGTPSIPAVAVAQPVPVVTAQVVSGPYQHQERPVATVVATPVVQPILLPVDPKEDLVKHLTKSLKERWPQMVEPLVDDIQIQQVRREELNSAADVISKEVERLTQATHQALQYGSSLQEQEVELRSFVEAHPRGQDVTPEILHEELDSDSQQVLEFVAKEAALDELLAALDELLSEKKICVDDFMREVRDVSRQQFMCKMMRQKAAKAVTVSEIIPPQAVAAASQPVVAPAVPRPAVVAAPPAAGRVAVAA